MMNFGVLLLKHKKHVPAKIEGTVLHELLKNGMMILLSAWFFQGILYMNFREKILKLMFDLVFMTVFSLFIPWLYALLIAHTLNFMLNGQFIAVLTHMGFFRYDAGNFIRYIEKFQHRIQQNDMITKAIVYGSLSEGNYKNTSDLDIRIIPSGSGYSKWLACLWAVGERFSAFFHGFPLDMYVFKLDQTIRVMKTKSPPVIFKDHRGEIADYYYQYVNFDAFVVRFKHKQHLN